MVKTEREVYRPTVSCTFAFKQRVYNLNINTDNRYKLAIRSVNLKQKK